VFKPDFERHYDDPVENPGRFGLTLFAVMLFFGFLFRYHIVSFVFCDLALTLLVISLIGPETLLPLQRIFRILGKFLGKWISPFIMAVIYFGIVAPLALFRRIFARKMTNIHTLFHHSTNEHREEDYFERPY
jgi:hypothetical protein